MRPPILDFDPTRDAVIDPIAPDLDVPDRAVVTWFSDVLDDLDADPIHTMRLESAALRLFVIEREGREVLVAEMGVGAPLAVAMLETTIAMGAAKLIAVGSAGGLVAGATAGTVIVPTEAIRDEGTSYHYQPAEKPAKPSEAAAEAIVAVLRARGVVHSRARTWTTDAFYRETMSKIRTRTAQGCLCVDMEASALFSVAEFRGVELGQILYVADTLAGGEWDPEGLLVTPLTSVRKRMFELAVESVLAMP